MARKLHIVSLIFTIILSSCDGSTPSIPASLEKKFDETVSELTKNKNVPIDEYKRLSQIEYKMLTFPIEVPPSEVESVTNKLGEDRWDCFSSFARPRTAPQSAELVIFCKRMPETLLRYIPKGFLR